MLDPRWGRGVLLLVVGALAAACSGPKAPLQVGIRELPSDVVLRELAAAAPPPVTAPLPPVALPLVPGQITQLPGLPPVSPAGPGPTAPSPAPAGGCPSAPAGASPGPAPDAVSLPPGPARYAYASSGSYDVSGPEAARGTLPGLSVRVVRDVVRLPGARPAYRFVVDAELGALLTSTTYTLLPGPAPASPLDPAPGLYLTRIASRNVDGSQGVFAPSQSPGMLLLPFPATSGASFRETGADATTGTVLTYTATVGRPRGVAVCGDVLGAVPVHLEGTIGSPEGGDQFTADYAFGTAFGAISLADTVTVQRTSAASGFVQRTSGSIADLPVGPSQPPACQSPCSP